MTVEIVPFGDEAKKRTLAVAEVVNDGTGDRARGNYDVTLCDTQKGTKSIRSIPLRTRIIGWDRAKTAWELVGAALTKLAA